MKTIKKIFVSFFAIILYLVVLQLSPVFAQAPPGVTFPVAELGNCENVTACKAYCSVEANRDTCTSFAKKKGFYKEPKQPDSTILQSAKSELGCDSETSCRTICEQDANRDKCSSFAQKHGLGGPPPKDAGSKEIIQKAQEILGCSSETSCRAICEQEENREKCSNFASQTGLGGGIKRVGPGGCTSEESCRTFCETNREACMKFGEQNRPSGVPPQGFEGTPGFSPSGVPPFEPSDGSERPRFGPSGTQRFSPSGVPESRPSGVPFQDKRSPESFRKEQQNFRSPAGQEFQRPPVEQQPQDFTPQQPQTTTQQFSPPQTEQQTFQPPPPQETTQQQFTAPSDSSGIVPGVQGVQIKKPFLESIGDWLLERLE